MKKWKITLYIAIFLFLVLIYFVTSEAVLETQNWKAFDLDYTGKEGVISSYGTLLAALLSSLSIIILAYTILFQRKEAVEQAKRYEDDTITQRNRFKKQFKLQKKQFKAEREREERNVKLDLFYKLQLVDVFLETNISHIEETGIELKKFFEMEKLHPLKMNMLYFLVNKEIAKLIEMDSLSIFKAFKLFFKDDNWTKKFNQLFNIVGFYYDALEELRVKHDYHKKDKFNRKIKIADDLKMIMDFGVKIVDRYRKVYGETYLTYPFSNLINNFIPAYYSILDEDAENKRETDLDDLSQNLLKLFLTEAMNIRREIGFDELGTEDLVSMISSLRKDIYKLKFDCEYFANDCEIRYNLYFNVENKHFKELKELKEYINSNLREIQIEDL